MKKFLKKVMPYSFAVKVIAWSNSAKTSAVAICGKWDRIERKIFADVYAKERSTYAGLKKDIAPEYVMKEWQNIVSSVEESFAAAFPYDFLRHPDIGTTMFIGTHLGWKKFQLDYLARAYPEAELKDLLRETSLGIPAISDFSYATSSNTIHHLFHLAKFAGESKFDLKHIGTVVEFGAGYGNMARVIKKINPAATVILIDLPVFSCIQSLYLKTIFGPDAVNVIAGPSERVAKGKINIVPFNPAVLDALKLSADLFVSTWALSETTPAMQDYIKSLGYFGARHLLMAYQKADKFFGFAEDIKNVSSDYVVTYNKETEYMGGNYYLFAEKRKK